VQLGGEPDFNPDNLSKNSHAQYVAGNLKEMVLEDLVAERIAIDSYREIIQYIGDKDPTTRRIFEDILAQEEEHADDMSDLLQGLSILLPRASWERACPLRPIAWPSPQPAPCRLHLLQQRRALVRRIATARRDQRQQPCRRPGHHTHATIPAPRSASGTACTPAFGLANGPRTYSGERSENSRSP
jgi:hypothetical protein